MKTYIFAALITAGFVFAACDKKDDPEPQPEAQQTTTTTSASAPSFFLPDIKEPAGGMHCQVVMPGDTVSVDLSTIAAQTDGDFTFNIVKQLNTAADGNFFLSPISVELAFAMLANGADGNSRQQILDAFGYGTKSINDLNNHCRSVISEWNKLNNEFVAQKEKLSQYGESGQPQTIETANAIWTDRRAPLFKEYIELCNNFFDAEAATMNFANRDSSLSVMNGWCNQKTHGMIPKMLNEDDIDANTITILTNSLYFKADWRHQFEKDATTRADFTCANGKLSKVDMMQQMGNYGYVRTESFKMAELPYNGTTCMDIILPDDWTSIDQCISQLSQTRFEAALEKMSTEKLFVRLPKFDLNFNHDLIKILNQLGVVDVFDSVNANLSKMGSSHDDAYVSKAFQLSHISVEESGTEAAAVTVIMVKVGAVLSGENYPIEFYVDRPFVYVIRDTQTGTILFIGKVEELN